MKHSVLVKRVVNVRIDNVEADSHADAIKALDDVPYSLLIPERDHPNVDLISQHNPDGSLPTVRYVEDGEENAEFLVDEEGDEEFERSRWYKSDGVTPCHRDKPVKQQPWKSLIAKLRRLLSWT